MSLKSSNKVETNRWQLEVSVDAETFDAAIEQAYKKEKNRIAIPGFRKGKAPRAFIEKFYGADVFYEDAVNAVYPDALEQAVKEAKLDMVQDKIDFDVETVSREEGLVFKATITVKPEITLNAYKGLSAKRKPDEVSEEDVDKELASVQDRNARMVTVDDRAAANGDIVDIDYEGFVDGKAFEGGKADNYSLTLGAGQFIPGFEEQVAGHKTGDSFAIQVTFPEDYHAQELKGKEATFQVVLHEIKVKELPALDDDFAKDVSDFDTLDAYRADVKKHLQERRKEEADDDVDNQIIEQLVNAVEGEIPQAMYDNKANDNLRDFGYRLQSQGLDLQTYMKYTGMDPDAMRRSFAPQAERQVKLRLALEKVAALESLTASEEDVSKEYQQLADNYHMEIDKVKQVVSEEDLKKDIAVEKAVDFVKENAAVTQLTAEEAAKAAEEAAKAAQDAKADK